MSSRSMLRKRLVLQVAVIRHDGQEKQLAHTLDFTQDSARLGGLCIQLEPGEVVEVQRGGTKARFQVFWMGAAGSAMQGQAGIRSLEPERAIWGEHLSKEGTAAGNESGFAEAPARTTADLPGEKRWHTRYECKGSAALRAANSSYAMHGEIKDVSLGGIYVESTTPLAVNTEVKLNLNIEGAPVEALGLVRTSYPMVGMGISFQNLSPENEQMLMGIVESLKNKSAGAGAVSAAEPEPVAVKPRADKERRPGLSLENYPTQVLAMACHRLAMDFEEWKNMRSNAELQELRQALEELQQKLAIPPQVGLFDYLASSMPSGGTA